MWLVGTDGSGRLVRVRVGRAEADLLRAAGVVEGDPVDLRDPSVVVAWGASPVAGRANP